MKTSITIAAALLAGIFAANAQAPEQRITPPDTTTRPSTGLDPLQVPGEPQRTPSTTGSAAAGTPGPLIPKGSAGGPFPDVIRNGEEPVPPGERR
jgi:hypothetical protein